MDIDPQSVRPISTLSESDLGTEATVHGHVLPQGDAHVLIEPESDFHEPRLPISIAIDVSEVDVGEGDEYILVTGMLRNSHDTPSFSTTTLLAGDIVSFPPENDEMAEDGSLSRASKAILDVLDGYGDPVPSQFVVESAVDRGFDRDTVSDALSRMEVAGQVYSPRVGLVGSL